MDTDCVYFCALTQELYKIFQVLDHELLGADKAAFNRQYQKPIKVSPQYIGLLERAIGTADNLDSRICCYV